MTANDSEGTMEVKLKEERGRERNINTKKVRTCGIITEDKTNIAYKLSNNLISKHVLLFLRETDEETFEILKL